MSDCHTFSNPYSPLFVWYKTNLIKLAAAETQFRWEICTFSNVYIYNIYVYFRCETKVLQCYRFGSHNNSSPGSTGLIHPLQWIQIMKYNMHMCLYTCSLEDQTSRSELRTFHEKMFDEYYCNSTCYETNEFLCPPPSLRYNIIQQLLSLIWSLQVDYKPILINNTYHHIMSSSIIISYHIIP